MPCPGGIEKTHDFALSGALTDPPSEGRVANRSGQRSTIVPHISIEDLDFAQMQIVDVRSPVEYGEDHIPGAKSVPLFSDREREIVGTLFREFGDVEARGWGEPRVRARLEEFLEKLIRALQLDTSFQGRDRRVRVICCARGGERSAAVTRLLRDRGAVVFQLEGGYRSYRSRVRERLQNLRIPRPVLLDGLTGCGKTAVLREVAQLRPTQVLDLEGLAQHRSSVLGSVGLHPVSQKKFESDLLKELDCLTGPWTLIEAESRRIGNREIPSELFSAMRSAPRVDLRASLLQRVDNLRRDYLGEDQDRTARIAAVVECLGPLAAYPRIGVVGVARMREQLQRGEIDRVVERLLDDHYDPRYRFGSHRGEPVATIEYRSPRETAEELVDRLDGGDFSPEM